MENIVDIYNRSVNIYKITDGEYIDEYVNIYLQLMNIFKNIHIYKKDDIILYGFSIDNVIIEECNGNLGKSIYVDYTFANNNSYFKMNIEMSDLVLIIPEFMNIEYKYIHLSGLNKFYNKEGFEYFSIYNLEN